MILNLKGLNSYIEYNHFKMESIQNVIDSIEEGSFMASVDLKDAFFSIPINIEHQKYLKFRHRGILYKFISMPNGYGPAMRVFTKVLKVPFSFLRKNKNISVVYVDDTYLQGHSFLECERNVWDTVNTLRLLGFTIHFEKSSLVPKQEIEFLGFVFNSINMTIFLSDTKKGNILKLISSIFNKVKYTIRDIASLLGTFTSTFPGVPYGQLHYRHIERDKILALKENKGFTIRRFMELRRETKSHKLARA